MDNNSDVLQNIVNNAKYIYAATHNYKVVDAKDYQYLDLKFYDKTLKYLESVGFSSLGDVEITSLKSPSIKDLFLRCAVSQDRQILGFSYNVKWRPQYFLYRFLQRDQRLKVIEFTTVFSNGAFFETTNFNPKYAHQQPDQIIRDYVDSENTQTIYETHKRNVAAYLAQNKNVKSESVFDIDAMYEIWDRRNLIQHEFKKGIGWVARKDLEVFRPSHVSSEKFDEIYDDVVQPQAV